ncbi:MAG: DUF1993 domain-containing protein [Sphingobium sp.]
MTLSLYDASVPVFVNALTNMRAWLDKAAAAGAEAVLLDARLAPDMRPLTAQYQMASDTAKNGLARLVGETPPAMADTEASFADLRDRCDRTIAYLKSIDPARLADSATRTVEMKFPGGQGWRFTGLSYLTGFALPNFFFHATTAYAILRANGVDVGKADFLAHLGAPVMLEDA